MENASQALIIAGSILIAIVVLSMGVYLITNASKVGESYSSSQELTELTKFNSRFTSFEAREDITAQEIITLANYVRNYNEQNGTSIAVMLNGKNYASTTEFPEDNKSEKFIKFITDNSPDSHGKMKYFKCVDSGANSAIKFVNGRISEINFSN